MWWRPWGPAVEPSGQPPLATTPSLEVVVGRWAVASHFSPAPYRRHRRPSLPHTRKPIDGLTTLLTTYYSLVMSVC
jgi:hypothetical protein